MAADTALHELFGHFEALRHGAPPFDVLSIDERQRHLSDLQGDDPSPDAITRLQIEADEAAVTPAEVAALWE